MDTLYFSFSIFILLIYASGVYLINSLYTPSGYNASIFILFQSIFITPANKIHLQAALLHDTVLTFIGWKRLLIGVSRITKIYGLLGIPKRPRI